MRSIGASRRCGGRGRGLAAALALTLLVALAAPPLLVAGPVPGPEAGASDAPVASAPGTALGKLEDLSTTALDRVRDATADLLTPSGRDRAEVGPARDGDRDRRGERARAAQGGEEPVTRQASGGVEIRDFAYSPRTITVNVGDSVRWTNRDQAPHDARAFDDSFSTALLDQGESDSVTFSSPGTFRYFCSVHPPSEPQWESFTGTVEVRGSGGGGGGEGSGRSGSGDGAGSGSGDGASGADRSAGAGDFGLSGGDGVAGLGGSGGSGETARAGSGAGLPTTGLALLPLAAIGLALLAAGGAWRRRA